MTDRHPKDRYGLGWWLEESKDGYHYMHTLEEHPVFNFQCDSAHLDLWAKLEEIAAERDEAERSTGQLGAEMDAARAEAAEYRALLERSADVLAGFAPNSDLRQCIVAALARPGAEGTEEPSPPALPPLLSSDHDEATMLKRLWENYNHLIRYLRARDGQEDE